MKYSGRRRAKGLLGRMRALFPSTPSLATTVTTTLHVNSPYAHRCFFTKRRLGTRRGRQHVHKSRTDYTLKRLKGRAVRQFHERRANFLAPVRLCLSVFIQASQYQILPCSSLMVWKKFPCCPLSALFYTLYLMLHLSCFTLINFTLTVPWL